MFPAHNLFSLVLATFVGLFIIAKPQITRSQVSIAAQAQALGECFDTSATGLLTGVVTASDTQQPISGILVSLYPSNNCHIAATGSYSLYNVVTDGTGRYTFPEVKQELYRISFTYSDLYAEEWYSDTTNRFAATPVLIKAGITNTIDVQLEPGGTITGRITARDTGQALPSMNVFARSHNGILNSYARAFTDATGQYTLTHLLTGSYVVSAIPANMAAGYAYAYYNDTSRYSTASPVNVSSGLVVSNINVSLPPASAVIYGEIRDANTGELPEFLQVSIRAIQTSADEQVDSQTYVGNVASGIYSITVPPGQYKVFFLPHEDHNYPLYAGVYIGNKPSLAEAEVIDVPDNLAQVRRDVSLTVSGGFTVTVLDALTQQPITALDDFYVTSLESQHAVLFPEINFGPGSVFNLFENGQAPRFGLRTDKYAVTVGAPGYASKTVNVQTHAPDQVDAGVVMLTRCAQLLPPLDPSTLTHRIQLPTLQMPSPTTINPNAQ